MSVKIQTSSGIIEIYNEVIANIVVLTTTRVFGVICMASKNQIKDNINEMLRKEHYSRGVIIKQKDDNIFLDIYIIVRYDTKIPELSKSIQEKVKYDIKKMLGIIVNSVNIFIQGVQITKINEQNP